MHIIKKGLNIPISGHAAGDVETIITDFVAVLGPDYVGMKPTMMVQQGDTVKRGQKLFEDKKNPGVFFTSPISGTVHVINRGEKRVLLSVIIKRGKDDPIAFRKASVESITTLERSEIVENLVESGLWTSLRTRPYSKSPAIDSTPISVFVTAMDSNPLAINPEAVISVEQDDFELGLMAVSQLTSGVTFVCKKAGADICVGNANVTVEEFDGPHPSGNVGTHIHALDPVNGEKTVWHLNYQDVIAIGSLFAKGELDLKRVISVAGPSAKNPKFIKTDCGASLSEILVDQGVDSSVRIVNGSVMNGSFVIDETAYLSKFALQVSLLQEGTKKVFIGWFMPGSDKFSITRAFIGGITKKIQNMTTATHGSPRSMVPIGVYEKVMPFDILPTLLLKAIIVKDTDTAQKLGVLELDEEDLSLCTFVCPSKYEYGAILRENLEKIEKEG